MVGPEPVAQRRVAILGGDGFLGRHLGAELVRRGHLVARLGRRDTNALDFLSTCVGIDGADTVVHAAADMGGAGYFHSDADYGAALANGRMTSNALQACAAAGVERLLYLSSACAYPVEWQNDPIYDSVGRAPRLSEEMLGQGTPDQLYGAEKLYGARLVERAPLDGRVAVLHTVYGPGQTATGQRAKFPPAVAAKALQAARDGEALQLWGDGRQRRSYLYVDDAVSMLATLVEAEAPPRIVNVGAEGAVTCDEVAALALTLAGVPGHPIAHTDGPSGVRARDCDMTLWRQHFGEPPTRSLADGFGQLIDSLREAS